MPEISEFDHFRALTDYDSGKTLGEKMDTSDLITLRAAQQISFEEMQEVIRRKVESLKKYAEKADANQNYLDRENKFLKAITNYINTTESLLEEVGEMKKKSDDLVKETFNIISNWEEDFRRHGEKEEAH